MGFVVSIRIFIRLQGGDVVSPHVHVSIQHFLQPDSNSW